MRSFFRTLLASFLSSLVAFVLGGIIVTFFFIGSLSALFGSFGTQYEAKSKKLSDNSFLHIKLNKLLSERTHTTFSQTSFQLDDRLGIDAILAGISAAKDDDKIKGIYLDISGAVAAGMATHEEIRQALIDFKKSNKFIVAYSEVYFQSNYYLASVADEMYIYPEGAVDFGDLGLN